MLKGPLSDMGQFLTTEGFLKMMEDVFYFTLKARFVLEIFTFVSRNIYIFGYIEKRLDKQAEVNFKIYDVTDRITNNYNTHVAQYLKN